MRGATVVLLALLTRALNPCCRSLSLRDADGQNEQIKHSEDRAANVSKALTFTTRHVLIACQGYFVEKCHSTHMVIVSVEKLKAIRVRVFFSRCPVFCLCEVLNGQVLGTQHKLELNQTILGSHKAFNQSSHTCLYYCHMYHLLLKYMNSYCFYLKNGFSESVWTNVLNVKDYKRGMNCVCFKVHIFLAAKDQVDITDKLCMGTGAWFMPANFTETFESNLSRLTVFLHGVKLSGPAMKALTGPFPRQTDDLTIPSLICVCTKCTMRCKFVQWLHRSVCRISLVKGNGDSCTYSHRAELYQFIWRCQLEKQRDLNQMAKSCFRSNMLTCTDMWMHKEISPLQWQICAQLFSRGLFHQWIIRVLLITVPLFLIGQTAVVTFMRHTQRSVFTQRIRNSNLSFMLLISWSSLSPLTVAGQSTGCSCKLHHTAFGITFVLCISCVLGKTLVVLMAFKATIPGSNVMKWFGRLPHRLSVPAFTVSQIFLFVFWFLIYFPSFNLSINCYQEKMALEYDMLSAIGFCPSLYHLGLSFILTFLVCNLSFTMACYSVLNIHVIMGVTARISLRALLR
uniref:G-protein coupled receptors family 3 profile domain-containing protein n=1 Tax=Cyprinus carpio TaxID=7962 RepID=A0A8C2C989_CYPCA